MIRRLAVAGARGAFNLIYRAGARKERQDEVVLLSRQADRPSFDFQQIAAEFERRGWKAHVLVKKVKARNLPAYVGHVLRELALLGRCKVAVVDRYDPVISLLDFDCAEVPADADATRHVNLDFPTRPAVLQLWHAFGAYKKFGHQSVGTIEGHSADFTRTFNIHRNYTWVVCSGAGARKGFAEAFSCPESRVIAMDRPEYDELAAVRAAREAERAAQAKRAAQAAHAERAAQPAQATGAAASAEDGGEQGANARIGVLMAPTLRKSGESSHPFRDLHEARDAFEARLPADFCWSFHPLETGLPAPGNVSKQLLDCDLLVTDYSSIVYEAYLLGVPALFYVPDIESYRRSPGLNSDPLAIAPALCAQSEDELAQLIQSFAADPASYPQQAFEAFCASAFAIDVPRKGTAAARLVDFITESSRSS